MDVSIPAGLPVGRWKAGIPVLLLVFSSLAAVAAEPMRVLVLHTFARDVALPA